jgi:hypothetical protein
MSKTRWRSLVAVIHFAFGCSTNSLFATAAWFLNLHNAFASYHPLIDVVFRNTYALYLKNWVAACTIS